MGLPTRLLKDKQGSDGQERVRARRLEGCIRRAQGRMKPG